MMTSAEIRNAFLNFFAEKKHLIVPSAPIVVKNDPTLLFTNAGMNQFKDYFLGNRKPENPRVADTQKCLRVSGKHNDLEEVGVDTYHHTMFEMLGNWSFGDYFKAEAIAWSWELLTEVYKLDKDRLYVTVFEGNETENLPKDEEAHNEWKKVISEDRILLGNKKDNFWEMGDTGPCGPCTEIHFDSRSDEERKRIDGKNLVNADDPQVIEIWNNVFMEFNRLKNGTLETLPARNVDTGMGLERLVRVIQGKTSNYDTDLFTGTIAEVEKVTGKKYVSDHSPSNEADLTNIDFNIDPDKFRQKIEAHIEKSIELDKVNIAKTAIALRVIADHIRAICFTIADSQLPSNTGAGYVIRRILRRAVRYYYSYLNYKQPLLFQLVPVVAKQFEIVFPELQNQVEFVSKVVKEEEEGFIRTLGVGLFKLDIYLQMKEIEWNERLTSEGFGSATDLKENKIIPPQYAKKVAQEIKFIDGKFAFELNDTYGFPIDLTQLIAKERGFRVDINGFELEMQLQKTRSRAATAITSEDWIVVDENTFSEFVGYDTLEIKSKVLKYRRATAKGKEAYQLVLNATPFYAESGGQVGDKGELIFGDQTINVIDTKKENNLIIHFVENLPKGIDGDVIARVNRTLRRNTEVHHSATHLLHAALRQVLGTHVSQKGSMVNAEHLRFDFSHFTKVTDDEITRIEAVVNEKIRENVPVVIKEMSKEEAIEMGAMALFGEKYGDVVRVVMMDPRYSIELCGGTHVSNTGNIGFFKIKHESAVAAGVRRIEAVSGKAAEDWVSEQISSLQEIKEALKNPKDVKKSIENLQSESTELRKKIESLEAKSLNKLEPELLQKAITVNSVPFIGQIIEISSIDSLKKLRVDLDKKLNGAVVLCASINGKAEVVLALSVTIAAKGLDASKIVKEQVGPLIKGGGGGSKTMAAAGGKDSSNFDKVIEKVKSLF